MDDIDSDIGNWQPSEASKKRLREKYGDLPPKKSFGRPHRGSSTVRINLLPLEYRAQPFDIDLSKLLPSLELKRGPLLLLGLLLWLPLAAWGLYALVADLLREVGR